MKPIIILFFTLEITSASCEYISGNKPGVDYQKMLTRFDATRKAMASQAGRMNDKLLTDSCSALLLTTLVDSVFPSWFGTPWDFNGTSNSPCEGEIACGYFVSTTLLHAGFNLNRYKLAQQASEMIVKEVCGSEFVTRYSSLEQMLITVNKKDNTLYVMGLNYHVGYLVVSKHHAYFIHSDYFSGHVKRENAADSYALQTSSIFVLGELTHNPGLIWSWLKKERLY